MAALWSFWMTFPLAEREREREGSKGEGPEHHTDLPDFVSFTDSWVLCHHPSMDNVEAYHLLSVHQRIHLLAGLQDLHFCTWHPAFSLTVITQVVATLLKLHARCFHLGDQSAHIKFFLGRNILTIFLPNSPNSLLSSRSTGDLAPYFTGVAAIKRELLQVPPPNLLT